MQYAHINEYGEIVWPYAVAERIKRERPPQIGYDWYQRRNISLPMNVEAVYKIAEIAMQFDVVVKENKKYGISITSPERLVDYYHFKRFAMSSAESCRDALQYPLKEKPSEFINAGVRYAVHVRKCFIADPEREGRMHIAVIAAQQVHGYPCLLICRKQDIEIWEEVIGRWLPDSIQSFRLDDLPSKLPKESIALAGYTELGKVRECLPNIRFWCAIVDHAEMIKNQDAQRTQLTEELVQGSNYIFLTTDFPMSLQVSDLLEPLRIIGKYREFEDLTSYMKDALPDPLQQRQSLEEQRSLKKLQVQLRSSCMVRRGEDPWLEYQEQVEFVPLSEEVPERYIAKVTISPIHSLGLRKIFGAVEWLKKYCASQDEKIVIFTHHNAVGEEVAREMGAGLVYGEVRNAEQRDAVVQSFLDQEERRVLVMAKDVEFDMIWDFRAVRTIVFVEPPFTPQELKRIIDRFSVRLKGIYLCTHDPMDMNAMDRLDLRIERMSKVLDVTGK